MIHRYIWCTYFKDLVKYFTSSYVPKTAIMASLRHIVKLVATTTMSELEVLVLGSRAQKIPNRTLLMSQRRAKKRRARCALCSEQLIKIIAQWGFCITVLTPSNKTVCVFLSIKRVAISCINWSKLRNYTIRDLREN